MRRAASRFRPRAAYRRRVNVPPARRRRWSRSRTRALTGGRVISYDRPLSMEFGTRDTEAAPGLVWAGHSDVAAPASSTATLMPRA